MNLSGIPPYWLNLILHATALGLIGWLAVLCLRHPRTRATAAAIGLLAIGLLPWLSALRTPEAPMPAVLKAPVQALPTWKITLLDPAPKAPAAVIPIAPVEAPPSKPAALPTFHPWQILAALWLAGTSLCLSLDTRAALRLWTWRRSQASPTDAEWDLLAPLTRMGRPLRKGFIATALLLLLACGIALPSFGVDSPPAHLPVQAPVQAAVETPAPVAEVAKVDPKDEEPAEDPNTLGQIKLSTRLLFSDQSPGKHGEVLRGLNEEEYFAAFTARPGYKLETCPSVTARANQEATIEIIRENPAALAPPPTPAQIAEEIDRDQDPDLTWKSRTRVRAYWSPSPPQVRGLVLSMNPKVVNDHLHLETRALYSQLPGEDNALSIKPEDEIPWKEVRRVDAALTSDLKSGDVVICSFGEIRPDRYLTLFIRVEAIDATGRPTPEGFAKRFPPPEKTAPAVPASALLATGVVFDFDQPQTEHPESAPPLGVAGVFNEEQFQALKRETSAKVRDLPAVKLTSGERRRVLWKDEVPRFWLGGRVLGEDEIIWLNLRGATFPGKEPASASEGSLGLYNGQYVAIALDPPPGVMRRELYVKVAIGKPEDK